MAAKSHPSIAMTDPTPLSPAAQVVWDAFASAPTCAEVKLAAALRAAADQVVPPYACGYDCCIDTALGIRTDFLTIAAELNQLDG